MLELAAATVVIHRSYPTYTILIYFDSAGHHWAIGWLEEQLRGRQMWSNVAVVDPEAMGR